MTAREELFRRVASAFITDDRANALLDAFAAEVLAEQAQVALSDRCPSCRCADCGGRLDQHGVDGCQCEDCAAWPETACGAFEPEEGIGYLAEQLGPLLSAHLNPAAAARCRAVAHAAHHALRDYDQAREARRQS